VRTSSSPTLIDSNLLVNLPLSRTATDLVSLAPGVIQGIAFGGSRLANPFSMDGTSGNEPGWGTPIVMPNLNWIENVQVISLGADAQYGEYTAAQQNAITRSGSNRTSGLIDYWTTRPRWIGNNRGALTPDLRERFRPLEIFDRWDADVQSGGPLVTDRLWYFAGGEAYRDVNRPVNFTGVPRTPDEPKVDSNDRKFIAKLTSAPWPAVRAEGYIEYDSTYTDGANAGPLVRPEAYASVDRRERMWNARVLWTINDRAFLEARHGGTNATRDSGPPVDRRTGPPGHSDQLTGVVSVNYPSFGERLYRPVVSGAHFTYIHPSHTGSTHEIRVGFEHEHARLYQRDGYVGGRWYQDYNGQPDTVYLGGETIYRPSHDRRTMYVQDGWTVTPRVTLNLGVRAGFYHGGVPTYEEAFSASSVSPRIGAAWDATGDHRTVLRVHYGRYHDEMVTSFYDFLDPLSQQPTIIAKVIGPDQFSEISRFGSTVNARIDPNLAFSYVREYLVGIERQMPWGISTKAQFIARDFKDSVGFIDTGSVWEPVQRPDPGPDGLLGTVDDGQPITMFFNTNQSPSALLLTNPAGAYRRYRAAQVVATKRYAHDVAFQASYTWSRTEGTYNNDFSSNAANADLSTNGVFVNPNRALNVGLRNAGDFTHEVKMLGTYQCSHWGGLSLGAVYRYQSGRPWARSIAADPRTGIAQVFVELRGTRQFRAVNTLDLKIEKTWKPSHRLGKLGAFADVFNVNNQGVTLNVTNRSGPNFGVPTQWSEPRAVRAGGRWIF
jgi:hypothetical protein